MDKITAYDIAQRYVAFLKINNYDVVRAVLFGSYATGNFNDDSDIDVAIVLKKLDDKFSFQVKLLMLTTNIDTRIEPHPFSSSDFEEGNPFIDEILRTGITII